MRIRGEHRGTSRMCQQNGAQLAFRGLGCIQHNVVLEAEAVYEAVAAAVAAFRRQKFLELEPGPNTEFTVEVTPEPAMQHKIRFGQVQHWAQHSVANGPADLLRQEKVRNSLAGKE